MATPRAGEDSVCVSEEGHMEAATMAEWAALFWAVGIGWSVVMSIRLYDNLTVKSGSREGMNDDDLVDDRLEIRYNPGQGPERDVHYKIIDGGRMGYLSLHAPGSNERKYEFFECSRASEWTRRRLLGDHCEKFERDFSAAVT